MKFVTACVVVLGLSPILCFGQSTENMNLDNMQLRPGMPFENVRVLATKYSLTLSKLPPPDADPNEESYAVFASGQRSVGSIDFRGGTLVTIRRQWEQDQAVGVPFASWLSAALQSMIDTGHRSCLLSSRRNQVPGTEFNKVEIVCGSRTIDISVLRGSGREAALITESLGSR